MTDPILIQKNSREWLRLTVDEFKGRMLLNARIWYRPNEGGDLRPGKDGWAISVERLPELINALLAFDKETRRNAGAPEGNLNAAKNDETIVDNIHGCFPTERPTGTSAQAGLRRLEKDAAAGDEKAADLRPIGELIEEWRSR